MKAFLEASELDRLERAADNLRDRLLIRMLRVTGARISEIIGLTVADIDLARGTITILHLKTKLNLSCPSCNARLGRRHSFCPGCGKDVKEAVRKETEHRRVRTLPIDADTLGLLKDFISRGGPVLKNGKTMLFGINRHRAWQVVRECADRAGLPDLMNPETSRMHGVSPHRLRDAFATMAVQQDDSTDSVRMLQEHLGHANIGTTLRYRKVSGRELAEWYQKMWPKKGTPDG